MRPRIDHMAENQIGTTLDRLESNANELKTGNQFVGTANVTTTVSSAAGAYDWQGLLPADSQAPSFGYQAFLVTAVASVSNHLFGDLIVYMFKGSSPVRYRPSDYLVDVNATGNGSTVYIEEGPLDLSNPKEKTWKVSVSGNKTSTYSLKAYVVAGDATTITWTAI